jgi:nitroreductase
MNERAPIGPQEVVDHAITSRKSIRAFLPAPVPRATVEEILAVAARAPSGTNTQPWKVTVLTGAALKRLSALILAAYDETDWSYKHKEEYAYYPTKWI